MKGTRLNAFEKALATKQKRTVHHSYTGTFKALKTECEPLFDVYEARPFEDERRLKFDLNTMERLRKHHERFNRQSNLTMQHVFYYDCQTETETERLVIAKKAFIKKMELLYQDEMELLKSINGGLIEGIHYELFIEKNN